MSHITLEVNEGPPWGFNGEQLCSASTNHDGTKARWTELHLYSCSDEGPTKWVLHAIGASNIAGEVTYRKATACVSPQEVVKAVRHPKSGKITGPGWELLEGIPDGELGDFIDDFFEREAE